MLRKRDGGLLKWREDEATRWRAGPFTIIACGTGHERGYVLHIGIWTWTSKNTLASAKSACEALASKIIRAVKKGGKSQ